MGETPESTQRNTRSSFVTCVCWSVVVAVLVWVAAAWSPIVFAGAASRGELGRWYWAVDLCASLASQSVFVVVAVLVAVVLVRRFTCGAAVCGLLVALLVLPLSEPRLGRASAGSRPVRLLVYNSHTHSNDIDAKNAMLAGSGADVAVVLEISTGMMRSYIAGDGFRSTHSHGKLPNSAWSGCPAILSRHAVEPQTSETGLALRQVRRELWDHLYRLEIVHAPEGSFALIQAHARSPRRPARWSYGLDQLLELADIVGRVEEITGLPVVVAGDFNSPPTTVRARAFADRSGLVRAKPALQLGGTFPASLPAACALAIDGVYASPGVRVKRWEAIGSAGSDHRAVIVELVFD